MTEFNRPDNVIHGGDKLAFVVPGEVKTSPLGMQAASVITAQRLKKQAVKKALETAKEDQLGLHDKVEQAMRHMRRALVDSKQTDDRVIALVIKDYAEKPKPMMWTTHVQSQHQQKFLDAYKKLTTEQKALMGRIAGLGEKEREAQRKEILKKFDREVGLKAGWSLVEITDELRKIGLTCDTVPNGNSNRRYDFVGVSRDGLNIETYLRIYTGTEKYKPSSPDGSVMRARGSRLKGEGGTKVDNERKQYVRDGNGVATRRFVTRAISFYHLANMFGVRFDGTVWLDDSTLDGQEPRAKQHTLRSQSSQFDVESGARVQPANETGGYGSEPMPGPPGSVHGRSGLPPRDLDSDMTPNERASMQVRDGSGDRQQMLSASAVGRDSGKVIRGNKGERFDLGPETVAMVEIDLSVLLKKEIAVLNQHSFSSHEYKVAYDRYESATDHTVKRKALDELKEYVYSAQKNREVVMDRIPNDALTRVQISGTKKWIAVGGPPPLEPKKWHTWGDAKSALEKFVKNTENLVKLQARAAPKMADRNSRT